MQFFTIFRIFIEVIRIYVRIDEITVSTVLQEGGRGQQKSAKSGSWPLVEGFEPVTFMSISYHFVRPTTAGKVRSLEQLQ